MKLKFLIGPIAAATLIIAALIAFPGAEPVSTFLSLAVIWAIIETVISRQSFNSATLRIAFLASFTLLSTGIIVNVWGFTTLSGATTAMPLLENVDQHRYFHDALATLGLEGGIPSSGHHRGYGLIIAALWSMTGVTIVSPLVLNLAFTMLTLLCVATLTARIYPHDNRHIPALAVISLAAVCYFMCESTLLLKEAPTAAAVSLFALSFTSVNTGKWIPFAAATLLLSLVRCQWLVMAVAGVLITIPDLNKKTLLNRAAMIAILCVALAVANISFQSVSPLTVGADSTSYTSGTGAREALWAALGDYFSFPIWKKLLFLPLAAAIQFLTPFPWNFSRDMVYGLTQFYAHISYPSYMFGSTVIFWLLTYARRSPAMLSRITLWGVAMWLVPCYLFAGTVSRYALPMLPMLAPAVACTLSTSITKRSFMVWSLTFLALIAAALLFINHYIS